VAACFVLSAGDNITYATQQEQMEWLLCNQPPAVCNMTLETNTKMLGKNGNTVASYGGILAYGNDICSRVSHE
jgi:hypothetical protein